MRHRVTLSIIVLVIVTSVSFLSSLDNEFTNWDDRTYVTQNPEVKDLSWNNIKTIFTSLYLSNYHPLTILSFALESSLFGLDSPVSHTINLALHILNTLLTFWLITLLSKNVSVALVSALLFAVHPLRVESVAWVAERKDVLYTFFYIQAIIFFLYYRERDKRLYFYLSLFTFIFSLLSKAVAITLPLILLLCDYHERRNFNRSAFLEKIPFFALSLIFGIIAMHALDKTGAIAYAGTFTVLDKILVACRGIVFYLIKLLFPYNLSAIYTYPEKIGIFESQFLFSVILLLLLTLAVFSSKKYTRMIIFGSLFFLITVFPVLRLVPIGNVFVADRYVYVPSIGLFYMAGMAFYKIYRWNGSFEKARKAAVVLSLILIIISYSWLTYKRNDIWQNSETLWQNVIKHYPSHYFPYQKLIDAYMEKGMLDKAIAVYREALRVNPENVEAYASLGITYAKMGLLDKAIIEYKRALELKPDHVETHNNLGIVYAKKGLFDEAIREYQRALQLNPGDARIHANLGMAYINKGRIKDALREFQSAVAISPDNADAHYNLGVIYQQKGMFKKAVEEYKTVLRINSDAADAHNNLGIIYSMHGFVDEAIVEFQHVLRINPGSEEAKRSLKELMTLKQQ